MNWAAKIARKKNNCRASTWIIPTLALLLVGSAPPATTDLCELSKRPHAYEGQLIDFCSFEQSGYHGAWLFDPECATTDSVAVLGEPHSESGIARCSEAEGIPGRKCPPTHKRVVGWLEEWPGYSSCAMVSCRFSVRPLCTEEPTAEHEPLEDELPMGAFMARAEAVRSVGASVAQSMALGHRDDLASLLTSDFQFTTTSGEVLGVSETLTMAALCPNAREISILAKGFPERGRGNATQLLSCHGPGEDRARKLRCTATVMEGSERMKVSRLICREQQ